MQTIYLHNKPILLYNGTDESLPQLTGGEAPLTHVREPETADIPLLLKKLEEPAVQGYLWESAHPERLTEHFDRWQAAGGLVTDPGGAVLLMFRRGYWDLPKGKMDPGESVEACALREVTEETGLYNIKIERKLRDTWHGYSLEGKNILKQTHWFHMEFTGTEPTIPQIEEDILDIHWIQPVNLGKYLSFSYPNIREVFRSAGYAI